MNFGYALVRTTEGRTSVCAISSKISVVRNRKKELDSRQVQVVAFRKELIRAKIELAKEWNRNSELSTTIEELNERNEKMWSWVSEKLDSITLTLNIPPHLVALCNLGLPFVEYTYAVQSAEMI